VTRTILACPDGGRDLHTALSDAELQRLLAADAGVVWVDLCAPTGADYEWLVRLFHFHHLAIEDCRHGVQRPKIEEYDDYLFFVFHAVTGLTAGDELMRGSEIDFVELDGFLGQRFLVTVHTEPLALLAEIRARVADNPALLARGADDLFYAILDAAVDLYFPLLDELDGKIDHIEADLFKSATPHTLAEIFALKKLILRLRRFAMPERETLSAMVHHEHPAIDQRTRYYLRDVVDHLFRINDALDLYRDVLAGAADTYMSRVAQRTNDTIKVLSIIATVMLPLGFLAGLYGMNFEHLPGARHRYGFPIMVAAMLVLALSLLAIFWRRGWFRRE
jgi:magnesium transporter